MLSENGACGGKEQRDDAAARHRGRSQPMRGKKNQGRYIIRDCTTIERVYKQYKVYLLL